MTAFFQSIADFLWGTPLLVFLLVANIILIYYSKLVPLKGFKHAILLVSGKVHKEESAEGQLSHFQALSNALAATIGMGNIAGVAYAINQGGPGAVFWMWVYALVGMNTKFFECTIAVMFRGRDYEGEIQGGPMYAIENGLDKKYKPLAYIFAIFGLIGTLALFQVNQLSSFLKESYAISEYACGMTMTFILIYILRGGLKRISAFTSRVVPLMAFLYLIICLIILGKNYNEIIPTFMQIFKSAFGTDAVVGGTIGYGLLYIIQTGVKRAAFSNEAGVGTAPMAHGNAKTNEPISEGYVAMLGPFIDTIIVCTLTALTILIATKSLNIAKDTKGINLTTFAVENQLGEIGVHFLCVIIFLFAFSTMIGMANYNKKCWDYLFKGRYKMNRNIFILFYSFAIGAAAVVKIDLVVALIDICYAMMAVPNIIVTLFLAKTVSQKLKEYNEKIKV